MGDVAAQILTLMGRELPVVATDERRRPPASEVERLLADTTKARRELGWAPVVPFDDGPRADDRVGHAARWTSTGPPSTPSELRWRGRGGPRSRSSVPPSSTRSSRSRPWRQSSSGSCPRATAGSTSRSGTASEACSRTPRGELRLWSRNGRPLLRYFPELRPLGDALPPRSAIDGEIVIIRDGALDFDAMQTRLHPAESRVNRLAGEIPATFVAFDVLVWKGKQLWERILERPPRGAGAARHAASSCRPRPPTGTRHWAGSSASRRSGSTASSRSASTSRTGRGARRGRQGETGEDGRLRRRRAPPARGRASGLQRSCSACTRTTARSTTSARPPLRPPSTTRSRRS